MHDRENKLQQACDIINKIKIELGLIEWEEILFERDRELITRFMAENDKSRNSEYWKAALNDRYLSDEEDSDGKW